MNLPPEVQDMLQKLLVDLNITPAPPVSLRVYVCRALPVMNFVKCVSLSHTPPPTHPSPPPPPNTHTHSQRIPMSPHLYSCPCPSPMQTPPLSRSSQGQWSGEHPTLTGTPGPAAVRTRKEEPMHRLSR